MVDVIPEEALHEQEFEHIGSPDFMASISIEHNGTGLLAIKWNSDYF